VYHENTIMALSMLLLPDSLEYKGLLLCVLFSDAPINNLEMVYCYLRCLVLHICMLVVAVAGDFPPILSDELNEVGGLQLAAGRDNGVCRPRIPSLGA
jgi:hypothetical protein